jgi:DNA-binding Xre family transcriptional regulator
MYEQKKMHRAVAERILAVRPAELDPQQLVPAIGSTRRVKALIAIKHGNKDIAAESGVSKEVISYLANDRLENVRADTAEKIRYGYARLSMQPGTSSRSLQRASVDCWLPPAAWDDDLIDLPEEELRAECARRVSLWSDGEVSSASCSYYSHGDRSPLTVAGKVEHYRRKAARQAAEEAARKAAEEAATQTIEGAQAA